MNPSWLRDAVFYEIYPQSFRDTNGDGIGDFQGIIEKLDYILSLGCNALWINPCYDSPFHDAGYDVRDYRKVAPRYGTNEDLYRLFQEAHARGMHVLLDLVPGHTSEEHPWFRESQRAEKNELSGRYIWTDSWFKGCRNIAYIGGETERDGTYLINFFKCQPALNYGFLHPEESWQTPVDSPDAIATREAMKDVMRFWLTRGCDGFRVDMAASLVKYDDEKKSGTSAVWKNVRQMLDEEFPEAAMVAEWCDPKIALRAGFHMDFYLNNSNGYTALMRDYEGHEDHSYFRREGGGDIRPFLREYEDWLQDTRDIGYISLLTCNHDTPRPRFHMDMEELKLCYAFLFTLPGVPFLYYGDEIGMRYLKLPTKEGGYTRTGTRTPMQWTKGKNLGFSDADPETLYLPVDDADDAPTVEAQEKDPSSLLSTVRALLALRHRTPDLQADAPFASICTDPEKAFVYRRGSLILMINPLCRDQRVEIRGEILYSIGQVAKKEDAIMLSGPSFAIVQPAD
ncbi:MAG: glycosylase [Clostridia bacterium]|nr:glycosylase [Clostridia bacterium]